MHCVANGSVCHFFRHLSSNSSMALAMTAAGAFSAVAEKTGSKTKDVKAMLPIIYMESLPSRRRMVLSRLVVA